ncbi:MAG: hypothetical protein H0T54_05130 [Geodermatophilaceae bacterium]|nr:hypothetical protein [Geodermatophilaceae bacterium]
MAIPRWLSGTSVVLGALGLAVPRVIGLAARSGVTDAEVASGLPGDDLVDGAGHVIDRATTISAPVAAVWPWIAQLGKQRAGWYFPRWVELGIPRARRGLRIIDPTLLDLTVGERVPDWGPGDPQFEVAIVEPEHALVYRSLRQKSRNWMWPEREDPLPDDVLALSWALVVTPVDQARSRLHLRLRMRTARERSPAMFFGGLLDWVTVALLFTGLRERLAAPSPR